MSAGCDCTGCVGCLDEEGRELGDCPAEGVVNDLCPRCRVGHGLPARTAEARPGERPYGWLLAHGWSRSEALGDEGANGGCGDMSSRNWRLHVALSNLRHERGRVAEARGGTVDTEVPKALFGGGVVRGRRLHRPHWITAADLAARERREARVAWVVRELLRQRARVRRVRAEARQMAIDFEKQPPADLAYYESDPLAPHFKVGEAPPRFANPRHSSESNDHFTPPEIIGAAVRTMGGIDCDPASCELAQAYVEADQFFTAEDDGFNRPWRGRVLLNPPGGLCDARGRRVIPKSGRAESCRVTSACGLPPGHAHEGVQSSAKAWWFKAVRELTASGGATELIFVGFSLEILQSTQRNPPDLEWLEPVPSPVPLDFAVCYPKARLRYLSLRDGRLAPGRQPTHSSFVCYVGPNIGGFFDAFCPFGRVVVPDTAKDAYDHLRSLRVREAAE